MSDSEQGDGPSLELPSFGFGKKRRAPKAKPPAASAPEVPDATTAADDTASLDVAEVQDSTPEETAETAETAVLPAADSTPEAVTEPAPEAVTEAQDQPTSAVDTEVSSGIDSEVDTDSATEVLPATPTPTASTAPATPAAAAPTDRPTTPPLFRDEVTPSASPAPSAPPAPAPKQPVTPPAAKSTPRPAPTPAASQAPPAAPVATEEPPAAPRTRPSLPDLQVPALSGMSAAMATGAVVGVVGVALTAASQHLCRIVAGTSSCGGPGLVLLLVILAGLVMLGSAGLALFGVPDPRGTSFLAIGLLAVVVMLFLLGVMFHPAMVVVVPLLTVGTFALSHWVTTTFVDQSD